MIFFGQNDILFLFTKFKMLKNTYIIDFDPFFFDSSIFYNSSTAKNESMDETKSEWDK